MMEQNTGNYSPTAEEQIIAITQGQLPLLTLLPQPWKDMALTLTPTPTLFLLLKLTPPYQNQFALIPPTMEHGIPLISTHQSPEHWRTRTSATMPQ